MCNFKSLFAACACLVLFGSATANAQDALLYGGTLYVLGSDNGEQLAVMPNVDATGYVVLTGNTVEPIRILEIGPDGRPRWNNINIAPAGEVDEIDIRAYGGSDSINLLTNNDRETVFDVDRNLAVTINAGNGADTIDPGVTFNASVVIYGGRRESDLLVRYFVVIFGRRYFLSPTLADLTNQDIIRLQRP